MTEILAVGETKFLTIERTTVEDAEGGFNHDVKIYEIDIAGATDVKSFDWLQGVDYTPVSKRLVLDVKPAEVVDYVDNLETIAWGPELENGNRSLVIVSDNNFGDTQLTQFFAVEVLS
ncbi:MAG: esterase-like activity of phytase family protein [Thermomicrobiales bacterium]